jgi:hypothetical protein
MDRTGRCAERHNATTTGPARVIRELLVEVNGTDKPRDSFIYPNAKQTKKPGDEPGLSYCRLEYTPTSTLLALVIVRIITTTKQNVRIQREDCWEAF